MARVKLISRTRAYATAGVPFSNRRVPLVAADRVRASVLLDHPLVERVVAPSILQGPVRQGDPVGEILIYDGDKVVARQPLVSPLSIAKPGLATRARWYAGRALDEAGDMLASVSPF